MDEENSPRKVKIEYFDLKQAVSEVGCAKGAKEKSIAGAKLFGKTFFNTALLSGKTVIEKGKEISEQKEKHLYASAEKLKKLQESGSFSEKAAAYSILKDRGVDS